MGLLTLLVRTLGGEEMERRAAERATAESDDERVTDERATADGHRRRGPDDVDDSAPDKREDRRTNTTDRP